MPTPLPTDKRCSQSKFEIKSQRLLDFFFWRLGRYYAEALAGTSSKASGHVRGRAVRLIMPVKTATDQVMHRDEECKTQLLLLLSMDGFSDRWHCRVCVEILYVKGSDAGYKLPMTNKKKVTILCILIFEWQGCSIYLCQTLLVVGLLKGF